MPKKIPDKKFDSFKLKVDKAAYFVLHELKHSDTPITAGELTNIAREKYPHQFSVLVLRNGIFKAKRDGWISSEEPDFQERHCDANVIYSLSRANIQSFTATKGKPDRENGISSHQLTAQCLKSGPKTWRELRETFAKEGFFHDLVNHSLRIYAKEGKVRKERVGSVTTYYWIGGAK